MSAVEIATLSLLFTIFAAIITWVWRVSAKLATVESKAKDAEDKAEASAREAKAVEKALADHRQEVAKEYVSNVHMANLENRLVEAIRSLGDRIDRLFTVRIAATS